MDLEGKHVVYVADCGGIAYETCKVLVTKKIAKLAMLHSVENPQAIAQLQALNPKTQIFFWKFDFTMSREEMQRYFEDVMMQMDYIDIMVNGSTLCKEQDIEATININLTAPINIISCAMAYMDKNKEAGRGGMIVNISSVTGLDPSPVFCVYSAAKFGVIGFTRSLAHPIYYEKTGVAVMAICCGPTKTFVRHTMKAFLEYGQEYVDKLKGAPCQETAVCARNIVRAIEMGSNGQIWLADNERLDIVKPQLYWKMSAELVEYMER
ncbi:alcohol dehydrogenase-related 31 kDa protein-like [Musca vetustissima]|uniref:alcohol dehydrogenase-related 31 kDa protein-like n=1 Tax=Musca vetustissima TaxID=27455 RepID=UPI002AB77702|nr:alcohol dehydrogenase-related 31 kDa protein-like [Musca vetustissima]